MGLLTPVPPPYDPLAWERLPLRERAAAVCRAWALQGYGAPLGVYLLYAVKAAAYVGAWVAFCAATPGLLDRPAWWLAPVAFQKAILWSLAFEGLGLGCGSGPLTGRYLPPIGGFLYFLRPGTLKRPLLGGAERTWLDVALYAALLVALGRALVAPAVGPAELWPVVALLPVIGVLDRTVFLAARAEHYWVTATVMLFAADWTGGAKAVQAALWLWAGVSKLNPHFPAVVGVMTSNSPVTRALPGLRRRLYRAWPDDLRPSRLAAWAGHLGTAMELAIPVLLVAGDGGPLTTAGLALMVLLHVHITTSVPAGVPLEWNLMVVYGGFYLFGAHADASLLAIDPPWLLAFVAAWTLAVPLAGNLWPSRVSFLLAMRYYAGNWACSVWLFRPGSERKLDRLTKPAPWVEDQLAVLYDRATRVGVLGRVLAFRLMHLHGRAVARLVPRAVPDPDDRTWVDGEVVAGLALGWNFGDGHLHGPALLEAIQARCGFEEGELRCIFVESQPLGRRTLAWRIADARAGLLEEGEVPVAELRERQPWDLG